MKEKVNSSKIFYINDFNNLKKIDYSEDDSSNTNIGMSKIQAKTLFQKYYIDFASSSSIHGFNHMTAPRRHLIERFLTAFFIIGSFISLIFLSLTFWQRFQDFSTVVVFDHEYRRFTITQPAVIACPIVRIDENKFPEVFKKYNLADTTDNRYFFQFLSNATYSTFDLTPEFTTVEPTKWLSILNDLKPDVDYTSSNLNKATWVVTEQGFCLAFNSYVSPYSSLEYWQSNNWTILPLFDEVHFYDYQNREIPNTIKIKTHDVMVSIYYPGSVVTLENKFYKSMRTAMSQLTLFVGEISSSNQVTELSLTQRKCMLSDEGKLKMWPVYTKAMCSLECRYNNILRICGCYPHFARPTNGIPICDSNQLQCIGKNLDKVLSLEECDCYADCDTTFYLEESFSTIELKKGSPADAVVTITIVFPTDKYKREQLFGFNDFLASVGGAAGLFLGASVISFIEILYFATLRLCWYKQKFNKKNKTESVTWFNKIK
ncbi:Similar to ppk11: Pickpocket protein 11 (Drosophila melanogaster) [Cotesia congregata]|uniref:Similar to ppk11: Pickpocket protein 11 (Drosophila melanogaster) n=1 Tax=Cotesia congregata TaxID=51543 RepID=A0A8J2H072_COTCN|nr:Similar to ppk11: Pickpocket protein 11 (Drosophila melanogaster) [Cotesia congregata]